MARKKHDRDTDGSYVQILRKKIKDKWQSVSKYRGSIITTPTTHSRHLAAYPKFGLFLEN